MELTQKRVLLLLSGGVESTALLLHLLRDTDIEVYTHFIEMHNDEGRYDAERRAIDSILPIMRKIRPFDHSETCLRICSGKARGMDYAIQYPIGMFVMQHLRCECILRAGCMEDDWDHSTDGVGRITFKRPSQEPGFSHRRRAKRLAASLGPNQDPDKVAPYLSFYERPKAFHVKFLGEELFPLTWSCRTPINLYTGCGKCHSCRERHAAMRGTSLIPQVSKFIRENQDAYQRSDMWTGREHLPDQAGSSDIPLPDRSHGDVYHVHQT